MATLKIIVCGNAEALNCSEDEAVRFVDEAITLGDGFYGIEVESNSNFKTWNGGPGTGRAFVRLVGYGAVKDFDDCRKGLAFMLSGGGSTSGTSVRKPDSWLSSELVHDAFDLLDEINDLHVETIDS